MTSHQRAHGDSCLLHFGDLHPDLVDSSDDSDHCHNPQARQLYSFPVSTLSPSSSPLRSLVSFDHLDEDVFRLHHFGREFSSCPSLSNDNAHSGARLVTYAPTSSPVRDRLGLGLCPSWSEGIQPSHGRCPPNPIFSAPASPSSSGSTTPTRHHFDERVQDHLHSSASSSATDLTAWIVSPRMPWPGAEDDYRGPLLAADCGTHHVLMVERPRRCSAVETIGRVTPNVIGPWHSGPTCDSILSRFKARTRSNSAPGCLSFRHSRLYTL